MITLFSLPCLSCLFVFVFVCGGGLVDWIGLTNLAGRPKSKSKKTGKNRECQLNTARSCVVMLFVCIVYAYSVHTQILYFSYFMIFFNMIFERSPLSQFTLWTVLSIPPILFSSVFIPFILVTNSISFLGQKKSHWTTRSIHSLIPSVHPAAPYDSTIKLTPTSAFLPFFFSLHPQVSQLILPTSSLLSRLPSLPSPSNQLPKWSTPTPSPKSSLW